MTTIRTIAGRGSRTGHPLPVLTAVVCVVTFAVSVAALASRDLMAALTSNPAQLRQGQWWRAFTPVLVQPTGWGQLTFNLLGLAVVGSAVEQRVSRPGWALVYLLGGSGSLAVVTAWSSPVGGGGSSDAVAAMVGAFTVLLATDGRRLRTTLAAPLYVTFFAAYLTTVDLAGLLPAIVVGNGALVAFFVARRALRPDVLSWGLAAVVVAGGALMAAAEDGHGTGILAGAAAALVMQGRRWVAASSPGPHPGVRLLAAVVGVWALCLTTWVVWVPLLGVDLRVAGGGSEASRVGWISVSLTAAVACLAGWLARRLLRRAWPRVGARVWVGLCTVLTLVSLGAPAMLALGPASRAALVCLHLTCGAGVIATLVSFRTDRDDSGVIEPDDAPSAAAAGARMRRNG